MTVVPPGDLAPADSDHYRVFTAFWRRWREQPRRDVLPAPGRIALPDGVDAGLTAELNRLQRGAPAAQLPAGGETAGRRRLDAWLDEGLARYGELADDLAADATSRLSPYLHFGCVSAGEVVARALEREGAEPFVRQLCWRDFNHQLLAARAELHTRTCGRALPRGATTRRRSKPGGTAALVIPSSMRGCGS